jgi:hypothetical protein
MDYGWAQNRGLIKKSLLPIGRVISVDYPSAHVFSASRRGLARAQGAHPVHGRT